MTEAMRPKARRTLKTIYAALQKATEAKLFGPGNDVLAEFAADQANRFFDAAKRGEITLHSFKFDREEMTVTIDYDFPAPYALPCVSVDLKNTAP